MNWLEFNSLSKYPKLFQAVFLRTGGVSSAPFSSLNVGDAVGDNAVNVRRNRELVRESAKVSSLVFLKQCHGANIVEITKENKNRIFEADGFYTREEDIGLVITHADCQAALFYDPKSRIIGAVHAGWRGLSLNIYAKMVEVLKCRAEDLIVCISPSLGPDYSEFVDYKKDFPAYFEEFLIKPNFLNLWDVAHYQLTMAGVKDIEIVRTCTVSNPKDYFSYRRDKKTGRHATVIAKWNT